MARATSQRPRQRRAETATERRAAEREAAARPALVRGAYYAAGPSLMLTAQLDASASEQLPTQEEQLVMPVAPLAPEIEAAPPDEPTEADSSQPTEPADTEERLTT